jgi:hypothetical protein
MEDVFAGGGGDLTGVGRVKVGEHGEDGEEGGFHSQDGGSDQFLGGGGHFRHHIVNL